MPATRKPTTRKPAPRTKKAQVLALLKRKSGATIASIERHTGWQAHTVRAALSRLRQQGHVIERIREGKVSRYRLTTDGEAV